MCVLMKYSTPRNMEGYNSHDVIVITKLLHTLIKTIFQLHQFNSCQQIFTELKCYFVIDNMLPSCNRHRTTYISTALKRL